MRVSLPLNSASLFICLCPEYGQNAMLGVVAVIIISSIYGIVKAAPPPTCSFTYGSYFMPLSLGSFLDAPCSSYTSVVAPGVTITAYTPTLETTLTQGPLGLYAICIMITTSRVVMWGPQTTSANFCSGTTIISITFTS